MKVKNKINKKIEDKKQSIKKYPLLWLHILIIILFIIIIFIILTPYKDQIIEDTKEVFQETNLLSTKDYIKLNINVTPATIYLIKKCDAMIMTTTEYQTYSIALGLENKTDKRPTTHDIIKNILDNYNIKVLSVKITKAEADLYYAELILKQDNKILNIDIRPSDAIAIAVRTNTPIYIKEDIFNSRKQKIC